MIEEGTLKVHYDGKGERLKKHQMKATLVSNSISALEIIYTEAFKEANKVYKSKVDTEILLEGGFRDGSLWWLLKVFGNEPESQNGIEEKSKFDVVSKAVNKAVETLKRISIEKAEIVIRETSDGYLVEIDGKDVVLDKVECAILTNPKIRNAISDVVMPLTESGIDTLNIENENIPEESIKVDKKEKDNLLIRRNHKHIIEEGKTEGYFQIETLSYNPKSKWKVISKDDQNFSLSAIAYSG